MLNYLAIQHTVEVDIHYGGLEKIFRLHLYKNVDKIIIFHTSMMDIAICIIAYNRTESLKRTLNFINQATFSRKTKLYISIDHSDSTDVEIFAKDFQWKYGEKEIILHKTKLGLRKHILSCGNILNNHDALIVLEDDIVVSPDFYNYAQATVNKYHDDDNIAGISLYNFPISYHSNQPFSPQLSDSDIYLMQNAQSWGQVWMRKQWKDFYNWYLVNNDEFEELPHLPKSICSWPKNSWLKYHTRYCIEENKFFVYPYKARSTCFADVGEHTNNSTSIYQIPILTSLCNTYNLAPNVKYDSFFENISIYTWLNLKETDICIDFYGDKGNREKRRFWLTRQQQPYKVIKSYGLRMKPYEMNIKYNIKGNDLFLYDTQTHRDFIYDNECKRRQHLYIYNVDLKISSQHETLYPFFGCLTKYVILGIYILSKTRSLWYKIRHPFL